MKQDLLTSSFLELRGRLHRIAMRFLQSDSDAQDALQDTWLKLHDKSLPETEQEARNRLVVVLRNLCIDRLRRVHPDSIDAVEGHEPASPEAPPDEDVADLERCLQEALPPLQKEIFRMVVHECLEYDEIAERLGMTVDAVRMNMSRARKRIRETYNRIENR